MPLQLRLINLACRKQASTLALERAFHVGAFQTTSGMSSGEKLAREAIIHSRTFPGVATEKAVRWFRLA